MALRIRDIRPGERRNVGAAFAVLFTIMVGHALLETARDALFLAKISATQLPVVYLGIAGLALVVTNLRRKPGKSQTSRGRFSAWLIGASVVTGTFWVLLQQGATWIVYALYVWSGILSTLLIVQFWTLAGDLFSVTQAKRLFAIIGSGSILGAIAGAAAAKTLVNLLDTPDLVAAAALLYLSAAWFPALLRSEESASQPVSRSSRATVAQAPLTSDTWQTARAITRDPYVLRIAGIVLLSTITLTLVDFAFKSAIAREVAPEDLGDTFATTYLILNSVALFIQIVFVGWMTRNVGIDRVLALLPALLLGGAVWMAMGGALYAAYAAKAADGFFRHSLHRTATEVLYVPLAAAWRTRVKNIIDVIGQRGGQAIASLTFLVVAISSSSELILGTLLVLCSGAWIFLAIDIKRYYIDLFRNTLQGELADTRFDFPEMNLGSLERLMEALSSPNENEVRAALDLFEESGRVHLLPALILHHPAPDVVIRALELFQRTAREDYLRLAEQLTEHEDERIRAAALLSLPAGEDMAPIFEKHFLDESPDVRATAIVGLLASGVEVHPRVQSVVETLLVAGAPDARELLARAIGRRPQAQFEGLLRSLAATEDPGVAREVARAMRSDPKPIYLPSLLNLLVRRAAREEARQTLVAIGDEALTFLADALSDSNLDLSYRRHLPRTVARFEAAKAAPILLSRLEAEPDGTTRFKILRALGYLASRNPGLKLDSKTLQRSVDSTLESIFRSMDWRISLERERERDSTWDSPTLGLILELLEHKQTLATERLFRLFSLQYPREDFRRIHRGTLSAGREARASSRELLEHVLKSPVREATLAVLDDIPDEQKLRAGNRFYRSEELSREDLLRALLEYRSVHLCYLTGYFALEVGATSANGNLTQMCERAIEVVRGSLEGRGGPSDPDEEKAFVVRLA